MATETSAPQHALIIGSGIGGLSSAIILAKLGFDVTVVEKNRQPGGMLRSYVRKGVHCDVGVHYLGALDEGQVLRRCFEYLGIFSALPLERLGVNAPVDRYHFNDDTMGPAWFDMPEGLDAYEANLKAAFPLEQTAIDNFMARLKTSARQINNPDILFKGQAASNLIEQTEPVSQLLDRLGCSARLKSVLSLPCIWIGVPPDQCPQFYHTMTLASYLLSAWRLKRHGAHMADVMADRLKALGGTIITGDAVEAIITQEKCVAGVTLASGRTIPTPLVIGAIHPKVVLDLLGADKVKPSYRRRVMGLTDTQGMVSVNALVPRNGHQPFPYNVFSVDTHADGSVDDIIYLQLRPCERPESLRLSLVTSGHTALWQPWRNTRSGHRGAGYMQAKTELAHQLIQRVTPITGPLNDIDIIDVYTPLSIRDWVNSPDGSAYGVMRSDTQMLSAALLNRTAVKGLFLSGQSVMAPGVLGTVLGSLITVKFIIGAERFEREIQL